MELNFNQQKQRKGKCLVQVIKEIKERLVLNAYKEKRFLIHQRMKYFPGQHGIKVEEQKFIMTTILLEENLRFN